METPPLTFDGARLVPYGPQHDEETVRWLNRADVKSTFGLTRAVTLEGHRQWMREQQDLITWAITDRDGVHQGNVSLRLNPSHASAYLQIYVGNGTARGNGLGFRSMVMVLDAACDRLGVHRVWLHTLPGNEPARRLYEKLGFRLEGHERESVHREGRFEDQLRWALLESEWRARRKEVLP
jgi:RimJ/RimL family protein N-acetyltransferase